MALVLDGNGTMTVGNGDITGLATGAIESGAIGAGAVLQVIQQTYATQISVSTTNVLTNGPGTVTITPKSSSSKIFVWANFSTLIALSSTGDTLAETHNLLYRGETLIGPVSGNKFSSNRISNWGNINCVWLDSPGTTSPVTYNMKFRLVNGSATAYVNTGESDAFKWTVMEIAG